MAGRNHSIIIDTSVKNGYNMKPNAYGSNYQRIVAANKEAKRLGISYGQYMAGYERKKQQEYVRKHQLAEIDEKYERIKEAEQKRKKEALELAEEAVKNKSIDDWYKKQTKLKSCWEDTVEPLRKHSDALDGVKLNCKDSYYKFK
jgi:hypothetical protein